MKTLTIITSILFVTFLFLMVGLVSSGTKKCNILPSQAEARQANCPICPETFDTEYCSKGDCACANAKCLDWITNDTCDWTLGVKVCGGVCNDNTLMYYCTTEGLSLELGFSCTGYKCGYRLAGKSCTGDSDCSTSQCDVPSEIGGLECDWSDTGQYCAYDRDCRSPDNLCVLVRGGQETCENWSCVGVKSTDGLCHEKCGADFICEGREGTDCKCSGCGYADINSNEKIGIFDLVITGKSYGTSSGDESWDPRADINEDGLVNILDLTMIAREYGDTC